MARVVNPKEFISCDTLSSARRLLGLILVRTTAHSRQEKIITEVEAYDGENDLACHASRGRTQRTEVMYQAGGVWYVYLCYGIHEMLNLVVGPENHPAAILIRAAEDIVGPGRLTKHLRIDRQLNGLAARPRNGLHLEDPGVVLPPRSIKTSARIGVDYAGPVWSKKRWRFQLNAEAVEQIRTAKSKVS